MTPDPVAVAMPDDSRDALRARQQGRLAELVDRIRTSNPFQAPRLRDVGPNPSLEEFTSRVPFTTKEELVRDQDAHPPYGTNLTFPLTQYVRCHQTSGTTGKPLRWLDTAASWSAMVDDWVEVLRAAGVAAGDRVFVAFSFGPFLGFWLGFEAAGRLGCLTLPGGGMNTDLRVRVLAENACTVLCCTPTYALHLAEAWRNGNHADVTPPVRTVVVAGEPGGSLASTRHRISEAWNGARVVDHHGMTEVGPVTHGLADHPGALRVLEESYLAEVVDPATGLPSPDGLPGELVLTTLRRTGSPLLRYRTGDLVRPLVADGRLLLEGGILGRTDDMLVIRGVNVYPTAVEEILRSHPGAGEYRVRVDTSRPLPELRVEVEATRTVADRLAECLRHALGLRVPVEPVPAGTLPRFELKARRWVRE